MRSGGSSNTFGFSGNTPPYPAKFHIPAVDNPVADAEQVGRFPDRSRIRKGGHYPQETFPVIPYRGVPGLADPVHDADAQYGHRFHPEEAVLDRRTPGVQDQDLHGFPPENAR